MLKQIHTVKCTHVLAQVSLGLYDEAGNLVGEEVFPQTDEGTLVAKLFHPHPDELASLIETCVQQAWAKLEARGQVARRSVEGNGSAGIENGCGPGAIGSSSPHERGVGVKQEQAG